MLTPSAWMPIAPAFGVLAGEVPRASTFTMLNASNRRNTPSARAPTSARPAVELAVVEDGDVIGPDARRAPASPAPPRPRSPHRPVERCRSAPATAPRGGARARQDHCRECDAEDSERNSTSGPRNTARDAAVARNDAISVSRAAPLRHRRNRRSRAVISRPILRTPRVPSATGGAAGRASA